MSEANLSTGPLRGPLRKRESHLWTRDPLDFYCEPSWVSERLFVTERFSGEIWDPACGSGSIIKSAERRGFIAFASDVATRVGPGYIGYTMCDFLDCKRARDNIVSNPPFGIAEKFVLHALSLAKSKVAMLLPANWVQGDKRSRWLETTPLRRVYFITPRPSMPPGAVLEAGGKPGNGTTDYAWLVWLQGFDGAPELKWLRRDA